ncbi:MAG: DUF6666 family protein [Planctomycetota bacterium]|nr:DUF6666 family protein [Planctomycetota bacterium]
MRNISASDKLWVRLGRCGRCVAGMTSVLLVAAWSSCLLAQGNPLRNRSVSAADRQSETERPVSERTVAGLESPFDHVDDAQVMAASYQYGSRHSHAGPQGRGMILSSSGVLPEEYVSGVDGEIVMEGEIIDGAVIEHGADCLGCADGCLVPCPGRWLERVEFFAGVQGVTGPANRGEMGSFGFYEGVNWGAPVGCLPWEIGSQFGARWTQSHFGGSSFSETDRNQVFVTGGFFRRADWGWQGGVVIDYLRDDWYFDNELVQLRGEMSWINPCGHEFGLWFTSNTQDAQSVSELKSGDVLEDWITTDVYAFFYRRQLEDCGATGRLFVGFSGDSDALIGADADVPLSDRWALQAGFTYLIPEESSPGVGFQEENWNISTGLVFYPGSRTARSKDYNHPLFNVADNGSMLINRK